MEDDRSGYRKLDWSKIKRSEKTISTEESLRDVEPIDWPEEVLRGTKRVVGYSEAPPEGSKFFLRFEYEDVLLEYGLGHKTLFV